MASSSHSPHRLRLLVVEDHQDIRQMLVKTLARRGYAIQEAESVTTALAMAAREPFDLVLSDWSLPDGTGSDLMKELKSRYNMKGVALSAYSEKQVGAICREAGFARVLDKLKDLHRVGNVIEEVSSGR